MAMANESAANRRDTIATAIAAELQRQGVGNVDIDALVTAVAEAVDGHGDISEGRHPDELNATNDD